MYLYLQKKKTKMNVPMCSHANKCSVKSTTVASVI